MGYTLNMLTKQEVGGEGQTQLDILTPWPFVSGQSHTSTRD